MGETLHSPEQLPDIRGRKLVFTWDQEDADSIVRYGDQVVWREWTGWEVYDRFAEIAVILQRKYGARLKDLVPTPRSAWALYGDTSRAWGHVESARAQLASGKPKKYSYWALSNAIERNDADTMRLYLLAGGYPSATNPNDGTTLLHVAARYRRAHIARLLIEAGAKVNALDRAGVSPLCQVLDEPAQGFETPWLPAASRAAQAVEIVHMLAQGGADLDKSDADGKSPLLVAIDEGKHDVVALLLALGVNVHQRDADGNGVLTHAVLAARPHWHPPARMAPIIETLRAAGADPTARNNDGKTARDIAQEYALAELVALL